jgi:sister-chromatid-cohesion protein PDS5
VSPELVKYLLPQLTDVVAMDDESARLKGVNLLAELFELSSSHNVVHEYPMLLNAFVHKFQDVSSEIRLVAVLHGVQLVNIHSLFAERLVPALKERILDPEEKVRSALVTAVCEACAERLEPLSAVLRNVGSRMLDKRPNVRTAARVGLCKLYSRRLLAQLKVPSDEEAVGPPGLEWLPQQLLQCYGAEASRDSESRLELEDLLQDKLLPTFSAADAATLEAKGLCIVHRDLQPRQRKAFISLLRAKRTAQGQVAKWVELQLAIKAKRAEDSAPEEAAKLVSDMCAVMPEPSKAKEVWDAIASSKDQRLSKNLMLLASPSSTRAEALAARDDLRRRLSQRLPAAVLPLVESIASRPAMLIGCKSVAISLLDRIRERLDEQLETDTATSPVELNLLTDLTHVFPEVLADASAKLVALFAEACSSNDAVHTSVARGLMRVIRSVSVQLAAESPSVRKQLVSLLCQACCGKDPEAGKAAAQCLTTSLLVESLRERTLSTLTGKLQVALKAKAGPQQHTALAAFGALAKRLPSSIGDERDELLAEVSTAIVERSAIGVSGSALSARCESQRLGIKLLANELLGADAYNPTPAAGSDDAAHGALVAQGGNERAHSVVELLLTILEAEGAFGAAAQASYQEQAQLRLAASCALLKLARTRTHKVLAAVGARRWHWLGGCLQDEDDQVRADYGKKLFAEIMRPFSVEKKQGKQGAPAPFLASRQCGLPPPFITLFALCALDPDKNNQATARGWLNGAVTRWRAAAEHLKDPRLMPEVQLPWLIHLLAHHPDFEQQYEDEPSLPTTQRCLDLYFGAVLSGGASEFDLLRTVGQMVKRGVDRAAGESHEVHIVADVAREILAQRGKSAKWSRRPVPHNLRLPPLLYASLPADATGNEVDMLPRGFRLLDHLGKGVAGTSALVAKRASPAPRNTSRISERTLPSPVGIDTGSDKKRGRRSSAVPDSNDEDSDLSQPSDAEPEPELRSRKKAAKQGAERHARAAARHSVTEAELGDKRSPAGSAAKAKKSPASRRSPENIAPQPSPMRKKAKGLAAR